MRVLLFAMLLWVPSIGSAEPLDSRQATVSLEFADAVSEGDADVMDLAQRFVQTPPTTREEIGFYGMEAATGAERALRGIIQALSTKEYLFNFEVQYMSTEFEWTLRESGLIDPNDGSNSLLDTLPAGDWDTNALQRRAMFALADAMGPFAKSVEAEAKSRGLDCYKSRFPLGTPFITGPHR